MSKLLYANIIQKSKFSLFKPFSGGEKSKKRCEIQIVYEKSWSKENNSYICTAKVKGKVPEWSIGPHSKCGVRATVPGVRIPPFPQKQTKQGDVDYRHLFVFTHYDADLVCAVANPSFSAINNPTNQRLQQHYFGHISTVN